MDPDPVGGGGGGGGGGGRRGGGVGGGGGRTSSWEGRVGWWSRGWMDKGRGVGGGRTAILIDPTVPRRQPKTQYNSYRNPTKFVVGGGGGGGGLGSQYMAGIRRRRRRAPRCAPVFCGRVVEVTRIRS